MDVYQSKPFNDKQLYEAIGQLFPGKSISAPASVAENSSPKKESTLHLNPKMLDMMRKMQRSGMPDFLPNIIKSYFTHAPGLLEKINIAAKNNDRQALKNAAHTMKSTNAQIGADAMSNMCLELEKLTKEEELFDSPRTHSLLQELEQEFNLVNEELRRILAAH